VPHDLREIRPGDRFTFIYKNYRGETSRRTVEFQGLMWGATDWHPERGFLMEALDLSKGEVRLFAVKDMSGVEHV
jgi:predicted DNA-binding transcriptional regulator YafY